MNLLRQGASITRLIVVFACMYFYFASYNAIAVFVLVCLYVFLLIFDEWKFGDVFSARPKDNFSRYIQITSGIMAAALAGSLFMIVRRNGLGDHNVWHDVISNSTIPFVLPCIILYTLIMMARDRRTRDSQHNEIGAKDVRL